MRALLDANALIAMSDEDHLFNVSVRRWWVGWEDGWASCPLTENGFLRILTQPGYTTPMSMMEAMDLLDIAIGQGNHEFWPDDLSVIDGSHIDRRHVLGPKQLTDIYLLALAAKNDGCLVTFDRGIPITAVPRATPDHLVVL